MTDQSPAPEGVRLFAGSRLSVPALLYHHVGPQRPGTNLALTTTPERFERQMRWLKRGRWNVISPAAWLAALEDGAPLHRTVVLTFDDGYADLARHAFPTLAEAGFGAAVYVVTSLSGGLNDWDSPPAGGGHRLLDAEAIREWSRRGIEIGGHTRTHRDLRAVSDDDLEDEVGGCADDLEAITGARPRTFAYPFGFHDERVRAAVGRHFSLALTVEEGPNEREVPRDRIRRTMVQQGDSLFDFACRVRLGTAPLYRLRARVARWRGRA